MLNTKPKNGDVREDGRRFDGSTWRKVGINHYFNNKGQVYYKRKYRSVEGYLQQGGKIDKIIGAAHLNAEQIQSISEALYSLHAEGYVYAIRNKAWPDWIKIGKAVDAINRLNGYQTSSPMRDYELIHAVYFDDRNKAERDAHKIAEHKGERKGEWFKITEEQALEVLQELTLD